MSTALTSQQIANLQAMLAAGKAAYDAKTPHNYADAYGF